MCLFSFLPGSKSRQGWALELSNISIKIRNGMGVLDPKKKKHKTSARQEKNDRREKAEDFVTIVAIFDITANRGKKYIS